MNNFREGDKVVISSLSEHHYITRGLMRRALQRNLLLKIVVISKFDNMVFCECKALKNSFWIKKSDLSYPNINTWKDLDKLVERNLRTPEVKSIDYDITLNDKNIKVGCQTISRKDAIFLAKRVLLAYGEEA